MNLGGCNPPPLDSYKIITPKAFDLEQVIKNLQQVGQAGKNVDAPKEDCLNFGKQCFKLLYYFIMINYTFLKSPYHGKLKYAKILKEMCNFSVQKIKQNFFASFVQGFPKSYKKSTSNYRK